MPSTKISLWPGCQRVSEVAAIPSQTRSRQSLAHHGIVPRCDRRCAHAACRCQPTISIPLGARIYFSLSHIALGVRAMRDVAGGRGATTYAPQTTRRISSTEPLPAKIQQIGSQGAFGRPAGVCGQLNASPLRPVRQRQGLRRKCGRGRRAFARRATVTRQVSSLGGSDAVSQFS